MAYQIVRSLDLGIANRSDDINAGAYSRVYKMDDSALYFVTTSLNKLHYIQYLGLSLSPIYAWYQKDKRGNVPTGDKKEYMMVVPKLNPVNGNDTYYSAYKTLRCIAESVYTTDNGWDGKCVGDLKITTDEMQEAYNQFPQLQDLSKFMLMTYKKGVRIAMDCHAGNVLFCPITDTIILYDIINFERMENKHYVN